MPVLNVTPLDFVWKTQDPFLFCVHHHDAYPAGNDQLGPNASLAGRELGQDFRGADGWRMYHGERVPGFPQHPHRGFETVTIVRAGLVDHTDSLGASARFGGGDVQWLTAGKGIVHCEMFPLVEQARGNPLELFQVWLNLPRASKLVEPHFTMFWRDRVPAVSHPGVQVKIIAGHLGDVRAPAPPPDSWASRADAEVAIWTIKLAPHAEWTLPAAVAGVNRTLYFFNGRDLRIADRRVEPNVGVELQGDKDVPLVNGDTDAELLLLQGKPIGEPVVQYGPFVMNTPEDIQRAFTDYRNTGFGGWPWPDDAPVHPREAARFAVHADGRKDSP